MKFFTSTLVRAIKSDTQTRKRIGGAVAKMSTTSSQTQRPSQGETLIPNWVASCRTPGPEVASIDTDTTVVAWIPPQGVKSFLIDDDDCMYNCKSDVIQ